jgi:hypothetical protein
VLDPIPKNERTMVRGASPFSGMYVVASKGRKIRGTENSSRKKNTPVLKIHLRTSK